MCVCVCVCTHTHSHIHSKDKWQNDLSTIYSFSQLQTHNSGNNSPFSHNYKHNLKITHQLVQTSNFQVKIKWFSQKHVLFCQNLIFGLRWHTNTQIHRLLHCLENTSEINSKHCYKNIILGNRRHLASQWLLQYMTWIEGCRYCNIRQYILRKVYFHYTTVKRYSRVDKKSLE